MRNSKSKALAILLANFRPARWPIAYPQKAAIRIIFDVSRGSLRAADSLAGAAGWVESLVRPPEAGSGYGRELAQALEAVVEQFELADELLDRGTGFRGLLDGSKPASRGSPLYDWKLASGSGTDSKRWASSLSRLQGQRAGFTLAFYATDHHYCLVSAKD